MINVHGPRRAECVVLFWANSIHHCWPIIAIHLLRCLVRICTRRSQLYDLLASRLPQWMSTVAITSILFFTVIANTQTHTFTSSPFEAEKRDRVVWFSLSLPVKYNWARKRKAFKSNQLLNIDYWLCETKSTLLGSSGNIKMHNTWFTSSLSLCASCSAR